MNFSDDSFLAHTFGGSIDATTDFDLVSLIVIIVILKLILLLQLDPSIFIH